MALRTLELACGNIEGVPVKTAIAAAVGVLRRKLDVRFPHRVRLVVPGHGTIMVNGGRVYEGCEAADCTLTASLTTFRRLLSGELDPVAAYVAGDIGVEGSVAVAMELAAGL